MKNRSLVLVSSLLLAAMLTVGCEEITNSSENSETSVSSSTGPVVGEDATTSLLNTKAANEVPLPAGVTLSDTYTVVFNGDPNTLDYLATFRATDSDVTTNLIDTLVAHDEFGALRPALASQAYRNDDFTVYKFDIRPGVKWVTSSGQVYPQEVTAYDFETGFQHLLDSDGGAQFLVLGVVKNADKYIAGKVPFSEVGVKAVDAHTLVYTLEQPVPYFMTMLGYNIFQPLNKDFFEAQGCGLGRTEWKSTKATCEFGVYPNIDSILYNGPYVLTEMTKSSVISFDKNVNYWDAAKVKTPKIRWIYDSGSNPQGLYESFKAGNFSAIAVSKTIVETVKSEMPQNLYPTDTNATTFFAVWNLDRRTYATGTTAISPKALDAKAKADTKRVVLNKNFRKAVFAAWDRVKFNSFSVGEDLKLNNIRNTYTAPEFVTLPAAYGGYASGTTWGALVGGEMAKYDASYEGKSFADANDPYFNATKAVQLWTAAKADFAAEDTEAGDAANPIELPIQIDIVYRNLSVVQQNQALSFKTMIEDTFTVDGNKEIVVNLMGATDDDYYYSSYDAMTGADANYDLFWGSGWGPDYGDPLTYLNTFTFNGDMRHTMGFDALDTQRPIYDAVLPEYQELYDAALAATTIEERYVKFAQLEAHLLDQAIFLPYTTQGGNYAVGCAIPRNVPYSMYGIDNRSFKGLIVATAPLTKAQRDTYIAAWQVERARVLG